MNCASATTTRGVEALALPLICCRHPHGHGGTSSRTLTGLESQDDICQKYELLCTSRLMFLTKLYKLNSTLRAFVKMIEFCTKRRMVVLVCALIAICVVVLYIENSFTKPRNLPTEESGTDGSNAYCWQSENYNVKEECKECTSFEKVSDHMRVCQITGFKELVTCENSGDVYKSCPRLPWMEKRNFWYFEFSVIAVGMMSWSVVFLRQKQLDYRMLLRIQKQISAGV